MNEFIQSPNNAQKNKRIQKTRRVLDCNRSYSSVPNFHSKKYQGSRNSNGNIQRSARQNTQNNSSDKTAMFSTATAEALVSIVKTMATNQELLMNVQERRIAAEERKADALETIAERLLFLSIPFEQEEDAFDNDESCQDDQVFCSDEAFENEDKIESDSNQIKKHPIVTKKINNRNVEAEQKKEDIQSTVAAKTKKTTLETPPAGKGILSRDDAMETITRMREQGSTFSQIAQYLIETGQPTFSGKGTWHAQTIHRLLQKQQELEIA